MTGVGSSGRKPYGGRAHQSHCSCSYDLERLRAELVWMRERAERAEAAIDATWRPEVSALGDLVKETAKECGLQKTDNARLRAELQAREAVVEAARALMGSVVRADTLIVNTSNGETYTYAHLALINAIQALDAVPRRAGTDTVHSHIGTGWCDANGCTSPRIERPAASPEVAG